MRFVALALLVALLLAVLSFLISGWRDASARAEHVSNVRYVWEFTDAGQDSDGVPQTLIMLDAPGNAYNIGIERGYCGQNDGGFWTLLPGEIGSVICWWGNTGSEIGVFEDVAQTRVQRAILDANSVHDPAARGNFKTIFAL